MKEKRKVPVRDTIKLLWEDLTAAGKENGNIRQEKYAGFHPKGCVKRLNHVKLM